MILATFNPAEWASAIATLLGATGALVGAFAALKVARSSKAKIEEVHETVNGNNTRLENRVAQLSSGLQNAGVKIPPQPPKPPGMGA